MVRSKQFIDNLHLSIVYGQIRVVVVVVFPVKEESQDTRSLETTVAGRTIQPVQGKMQQVDRPLGREAKESQAKGRQLHNGVLDKAILPGLGTHQILGVGVMTFMKLIQARNVQNVVHSKGPRLAHHVTGQKLEGTLPPRVLLGLHENGIRTVIETKGGARQKERDQVDTETLPTFKVVRR